MFGNIFISEQDVNILIKAFSEDELSEGSDSSEKQG